MKLRKIAILLVVLAALALTCGCTEVTELTVAGSVVDRVTSEGMPAEITVKIYAARSTYTNQVATNEDGTFSLIIKTHGATKIEFTAEAEGYQPLTLETAETPTLIIEVTKINDENLTLLFALEKL
jgi:hypothetical protein